MSGTFAQTKVRSYDWQEGRQEDRLETPSRAKLEPVDVFRSVLSTLTQFRGILDTEGVLLEINQAAVDFSGLPRDLLLGQALWQGPWWPSELVRQEVHRMTEEALHGTPSSAEFELVGAGRQLWVEVNFRPIRNAADAVVMLLVEGNDIAERKRLEQELRNSERQHRLVIEAMSEGVLQFEADGTVSICNKAAERLLGQSRARILGRKPTDDWLAITEDGRPITITDPQLPTATTFRTGQPQTNFVMGVHKPSGELVWTLVNTQPLKHQEDALPYAVVVTLTDITERKKLEDKLRQAALYDALTGLPTRTLLMERLAQASHRSHRDGQAKFAVLFLDLDNFKSINDSFGHEAGDSLLKKVSKLLQGCIREADTVARLGGDEFVVLLEGITSCEAAKSFAERVLKALQLEQCMGAKTINVQASIGIALGDAHADPNRLLKRADEAMYQAKSKGRGQVAVWSN